MWRQLKLYYYRTLREKGTSESIALGVALGLGIGFLIPMGFQLLIVLPLAYFLKASKLAAGTFTFVTNHFTVFIIYPLQTLVGMFILGGGVGFGEIMSRMGDFLKAPSYEALFKLGPQIVWGFFLGGAVFAIAASIPGYFISLALIRKFRERRFKLHLKKKSQ